MSTPRAHSRAASGVSLDEFKSALPIAEIVGRFVKLTRKGRDLWGCCPFHQEKTASFHVVPDRGYYHCFGCGEHGNAIDFVMAVERLEFRDALERLSELTGIAAPDFGSSRDEDAKTSLFDVNVAAMEFYQDELKGESARHVRDYLERRRIEPDSQQAFALGFAPNRRDAVRQALHSRGFSDEVLLEAGIVARSNRDRSIYDRFRNRIMFPIADAKGRICGFGGRSLDPEANAKYLNTAETPVFKKGLLLYGIDKAATPARRANAVFVAEGYLDVIALHAAGLIHAVAPLGTAVTEDQLRSLWRHVDAPVFCLDGDTAGLRAAHRAALRALPLLRPGKSLDFCILPEGEDPDSLRANQGDQHLRTALQQTVSLIDLIWRQALSESSTDTPETRALLDRRLFDTVASIQDRDVRSQYRRELRNRLNAYWRSFRKVQNATSGADRRQSASPGSGIRQRQFGKTQAGSLSVGSLAQRLKSPDVWSEYNILGTLLANPWLLRHSEEILSSLEFSQEPLEAMRQELILCASDRIDLDGKTLEAHLVRYGHGCALDQIAKSGIMSQVVTSEDPEFVASWHATLTQFMRRKQWRREVDELEKQSLSERYIAASTYLNDLSNWSYFDDDPESERRTAQSRRR